MIMVALQSVSFMKNSKILLGKFTLKNWIYKRYIILENLLLKCAKNKSYADELETIFNNYSEFQREQLPQRLEKFLTAYRQVKDDMTFHHYLM